MTGLCTYVREREGERKRGNYLDNFITVDVFREICVVRHGDGRETVILIINVEIAWIYLKKREKMEMKKDKER